MLLRPQRNCQPCRMMTNSCHERRIQPPFRRNAAQEGQKRSGLTERNREDGAFGSAVGMKQVVAQLVVVFGSVLVAGPGLAASVLNTGSSAVVLVVVEDGTKTEVALDAGGSDTICAAGCFLTLPNGDRIGLAGGETVEIKDGVATIK